MFKKIFSSIVACFSFWKGFIVADNKGKFLKDNSSSLMLQLIVILATFLSIFILYSALKPAVRGACRVILQSDDDLMSVFRGRVVGVEAKKVIKGTTLREVKSIGSLKANDEVVLKVELPTAKIQDIKFKEGSFVNKGDELIVFEDDYYRSETARLEAQYQLRKAEFERAKRLYDQKAGSQKTYDEAIAQMNEAKAQLDGAKFQLSKTVIKAPFDGIIGIMKVSKGSIVQQHTELVNIVDSSIVKVEFMVAVKYIEDIAVGQDVDIAVDAFKDRVFSGVVDAIDSEVDVKNHSILVRAVIPNQSGVLKHGMFANVKLVTGEKSDAILIDEDALDRDGAIEFVWCIDEKGRAYRKRVLTGAKDANGIEILDGLKEGDIVVVAGQLKLTDGVPTKILNKKEIDGASDNSESDDKNESSSEESNAEDSDNDSEGKKDEQKDEADSDNEEKNSDNAQEQKTKDDEEASPKEEAVQ
ncbi:MAG: efflux RND transporter periplasmic adaptor subunit [Holosporales bacterium]|jgi:membrane fusion protein (multidrug efflux system)|nr:efflux RND transporter periplasmic adaptor subunit [Holosporales bacterium]